MPATVTLSALAYELGRPRRLADLAELRERPDLLAALESEAAGLRYFLDSDATLLELARRAAERTLLESGVPPREIGAVVFASDSFRNDPGQYAELGRFLADLGLEAAYPLNVTLSDCANVQIALRVAASLVRGGELGPVLLVSADLARHASPGTRVIADGIAVASDAAASLLVSDDASAPLAVRAVAQKTTSDLLDPGGDDRARLTSRVLAHRDLFADLLGRAGLEPSAVRQVFANNFARNVLRLFLADSGFAEERIYLDNIARVGHCLGSDCLVNLLDWAHRHPIEEGEHFVLLGSGASQLGAVLLESACATSGEGLEGDFP